MCTCLYILICECMHVSLISTILTQLPTHNPWQPPPHTPINPTSPLTHTQYSNRKLYNPLSFCNAFTNYRGASISTSEQYDSVEFMLNLLNKLDELSPVLVSPPTTTTTTFGVFSCGSLLYITHLL